MSDALPDTWNIQGYCTFTALGHSRGWLTKCSDCTSDFSITRTQSLPGPPSKPVSTTDPSSSFTVKLLFSTSTTAAEWPQRTASPLHSFITPPHLFFLPSLRCRTVVGLVEEDFLHLPVLKVVQLTDGVLGAGDQVHHYSHWPLSA